MGALCHREPVALAPAAASALHARPPPGGSQGHGLPEASALLQGEGLSHRELPAQALPHHAVPWTLWVSISPSSPPPAWAPCAWREWVSPSLSAPPPPPGVRWGDGGGWLESVTWGNCCPNSELGQHQDQ